MLPSFTSPCHLCTEQDLTSAGPNGTLAHVLGFSALPVRFFLILFGMVLTYLALVEFVKSRFYAIGHSRPVRTPPDSDQRHAHRLRRRAGPFNRFEVS